jgi:integrase/recombinase XerC
VSFREYLSRRVEATKNRISTAHLNASDGNVRAAQALSRHADLKTLSLYDDNRHQHQKGATDLLGSLLDE